MVNLIRHFANPNNQKPIGTQNATFSRGEGFLQARTKEVDTRTRIRIRGSSGTSTPTNMYPYAYPNSQEEEQAPYRRRMGTVVCRGHGRASVTGDGSV